MAKQKFITVALPEPVEIVDENGVVQEVTRFIVPIGEKDTDFCKVYNHLIDKLSDLSKSERKVFDWCLKNMDYENKVYILNQKKLASTLNLSYGTVRNAVSSLTRKGLLKKIENGLYLVNPAIACKTTVDKRKNILIQFVDKEEYEEFISKINKEVEDVRG